MNAEDVLQACLDALEAGRTTVPECVARYPDVEGLGEQLLAAQNLRSLRTLSLRPEVSRAQERRLRAALRAAAPVPQSRAAGRPALRLPVLRFGLAAVLVLSLVLASAGAASAASASVPGEWLYPVKQSLETVQVRVTPPSGQASLHAGLAEQRAKELVVLSDRGSQAAVLETAIAAMSAETGLSLDFVGQAPADQRAALLSKILDLIDRQQAILAAVAAQAPAQALATLNLAQQVTSAERLLAQAKLEALQDTQAGDQMTAEAVASATPTSTHVPPGQTRVPPGQTRIPPGHTGEPTSTHVPPGQTRIPPGQSQTPPGHARTSPTPQVVRPTRTPQARPACRSTNPSSPNYCTPTPTGGGGNPPPTQCPTNPSGKPKC